MTEDGGSWKKIIRNTIVTVRTELRRPQTYLEHEEYTVVDDAAFKHCRANNYMFTPPACKMQFEESLR